MILIFTQNTVQSFRWLFSFPRNITFQRRCLWGKREPTKSNCRPWRRARYAGRRVELITVRNYGTIVYSRLRTLLLFLVRSTDKMEPSMARTYITFFPSPPERLTSLALAFFPLCLLRARFLRPMLFSLALTSLGSPTSRSPPITPNSQCPS